MRDEALWTVTLCINEGDMVVHVADTLQLVRMPMVVRTAIHTNQKDGHMGPRKTQKIKLKFVHISGLAVEQEKQAQNWCLRTCLPAVDGMMDRGLGMLL